MKPKWLSRRRTIAALLVITMCATAAWWMLPARHQGLIAAWVDGVRGHDEIKAFGLPSPQFVELARQVKARCGVTIDQGGCCATKDQLEYAQAYDSVVFARVRARVGSDVFVDCKLDSLEAWIEAVR